MPKTAINFYNLRKGLYLKNGGTSATGKLKAKSTSLLNGFGELNTLETLEVGGG